MSVQKISNAILGVGVDDTTIDLFESQYPVPTGVSYNSYVILDEKVAHTDTEIILNVNLDPSTSTHFELIDAVVHYLF